MTQGTEFWSKNNSLTNPCLQNQITFFNPAQIWVVKSSAKNEDYGSNEGLLYSWECIFETLMFQILLLKHQRGLVGEEWKKTWLIWLKNYQFNATQIILTMLNCVWVELAEDEEEREKDESEE